MYQYLAVPQTGDSEYRLYNTDSVGFTMVETGNTRVTNSGTVRDVTRHVGRVSLTGVNGSLTAATSGTVLAIINKNGHVTPICDPTP